jgi:hypothetical protein
MIGHVHSMWDSKCEIHASQSEKCFVAMCKLVSQGENVAKEELFPWVFEFETHWCDHFKLLITFLGLHSDKEKDRASEEI